MGSFTAQEILAQLDECAQRFTFPMLDNGYVYLADARLSAYRDETHWAIIIEVLGTNNRAGGHDNLQNGLHCFGNCLKRPPGLANGDFLFVTSDGLEGPTFDEEFDCRINEAARTIRIRDQIIPIDVAPVSLARKAIELAEPPEVTGADLLRTLVPEYRDLLLATEEELRRRMSSDLPLILRLEEWHHPDLAGNELPSESETFQQIAQVLEDGDPSQYHPSKTPNTHWRNWPEGGTL